MRMELCSKVSIRMVSNAAQASTSTRQAPISKEITKMAKKMGRESTPTKTVTNSLVHMLMALEKVWASMNLRTELSSKECILVVRNLVQEFTSILTAIVTTVTMPTIRKMVRVLSTGSMVTNLQERSLMASAWVKAPTSMLTVTSILVTSKMAKQTVSVCSISQVETDLKASMWQGRRMGSGPIIFQQAINMKVSIEKDANTVREYSHPKTAKLNNVCITTVKK